MIANKMKKFVSKFSASPFREKVWLTDAKRKGRERKLMLD